MRTRCDTDRRVVKVSLTERGRDAAAGLPQIGATVLNAQLDGFSRAELDLLIAMLGRIIGNSPAVECCVCSDEESD